MANSVLSMNSVLFKPATLIMYQGGGYDGCIWEWNLAFIDDDGKFHSAFSSGSMGCPNNETLEERYTEWYEQSMSGSWYNSEDFLLFDLEKAEDLEQFSCTAPIPILLLAASWLSENRPQTKIDYVCDCCKQVIDLVAAPVHGEGYSGAGGTMIVANEIVCEDCYNTCSCAYCGEFYGPTKMDEEHGYCADCLKRHVTKEDHS